MDEVRRRGSAARMAYMKRFLSFILCVVLVAGLMEPPKAEAAFVVDDALLIPAALSLIGAIWIGSGAQFGSQDGLLTACQDVYDRYIAPSVDLAKEMARLVTDSYYAKQLGVFAAINVSARLWQAICGNPVAENVKDGQYGVFSEYYLDAYDADIFSSISSALLAHPFLIVNGHSYYCRGDSSVERSYAYVDGVLVDEVYCASYHHHTPYIGFRFGNFYSGFYVSYLGNPSYFQAISELISFPVTLSCQGLSIPLAGDVVRPGEDDRVIAVPDVLPRIDTGTGAVEMPVLSLDQADYLVGADVLTAAGTQEDVVVNAATGEKVQAGTDEGTDTKAEVGDIALEDIQAQEQALGMVFISKFPFSIPWDVFKAVQLLAAPAEAPYWEVDFLAPMEHRVGAWQGDTTVVIDMGEYPIIGQVCRWASTFMFVWALMLGTKRLIWTA